ncbi:MAG: ferrous iron transport protein A [Candidatus Nanopelagicales bacterium]|jgi:Fe2+ transport system protein FeoA|nr:ferrous iron transport protein A [Candidatus Nanopelagicales bacterium]
MKLDAARPGQSLTVLAPSGTSEPNRPGGTADATTRRVRRRLAELGIRPGAGLQILSRTSGGGAILAIGDDRIAVSHQVLATIEVGAEVSTHG